MITVKVKFATFVRIGVRLSIDTEEARMNINSKLNNSKYIAKSQIAHQIETLWYKARNSARAYWQRGTNPWEWERCWCQKQSNNRWTITRSIIISNWENATKELLEWWYPPNPNVTYNPAFQLYFFVVKFIIRSRYSYSFHCIILAPRVYWRVRRSLQRQKKRTYWILCIFFTLYSRFKKICSPLFANDNWQVAMTRYNVNIPTILGHLYGKKKIAELDTDYFVLSQASNDCTIVHLSLRGSARLLNTQELNRGEIASYCHMKDV